jgi:hypothetical protein
MKSSLAFALIFLTVAPPVNAQENPFRGKPPLKAKASNSNIVPEPTLDPLVSGPLNSLLERKDWAGLRRDIGRPPSAEYAKNALNWLKVKSDNGAPFMISLLYSENLWALADALRQDKSDGDGVEGIQNQSAFMALYTVAVMRMDGMACGDSTAVGHRFDQILAGPVGAALRYAAKLQPAQRRYMTMLAVGLEAATALRRPAEDDLLCRGGMQELSAGMAAQNFGDPHPEPGHVGKVVTVTPPADFKVSFRPAAEYQKEQAAFRGADLYDYLWKLLGSK